jgi:hypothetical protein
VKKVYAIYAMVVSVIDISYLSKNVNTYAVYIAKIL